MHPSERRTVAVLASVMSVRMLGLFMLLPVMALYARELAHSTPALIGLAVGAYGITQALLQIPFGMISDRLGRRPVILCGLLLFIGGSVVAAMSQDILWLIAGRALQGAGAISAATTALLADRTRENVRTRAMAVVGATIGVSFILSLVLGPLLAAQTGVQGLLWLTAALGTISFVLVAALVPASATVQGPDSGLSLARLRQVLSNRSLAVLNSGVFILHFALTAVFVTVPLGLADAGIGVQTHWKIYLLAMLGSLLGTIPLILLGERRPGFVAGPYALLALAIGCAAMALQAPGWLSSVLALAVFFAGFNYAEARFPARLSQLAPASERGAAFGVYATSQFLGAFVGGSAAGMLLGSLGPVWVLGLCAALFLLWLPLSKAL